MLKLILILLAIWAILMGFRIGQIGGIDLEYQDPKSQLFESTRENLSKVISQSLSQPQASILSGMVLGQDTTIPIKFKKDLTSTSTIHLLVVSGQNLSIMAGFLMSMVYIIGRRKTALVTILAIIGYSLLTGLGVPVVRAAIMASCSLIAQILGREVKGWWILSLTGLLMLLYNPNWLFNISFQLSFLATSGVVIASPILVNYLGLIPKVIKEDLSITLSAYFLTLPVIVFNFHQLSLVGIVTNILVLWTSPLIMVSGVVTIIAGLISQTLANIFGLIPWVLITYFIYIVEFFANVTTPVILIGQTTILFWLGYYLLIIGILLCLHIRAIKVTIQE